MKVDLSLFFPPGARVLAFPNRQQPRLFLSADDPFLRWEQSSLYPASRRMAKLYRLSLRLRAMAGSAQVQTVRSSSWPMREFTQDVMPNLKFVVVLIGTPGPAQEITVQLRDEENRVQWYLKYAEKETARRRLRQERFMISNLPASFGPKPKKFGLLGEGEALIKSALPGAPLSATLPPPRSIFDLLDSLIVYPPVSLEDHPWVRRIRNDATPGLDTWLEPLAKKSWPVTVQHGDFVPWNLLQEPDGTLWALDWEYGTLEGFPYLDLIYYVLQTLALIYRREPLEAARWTVEYLSRQQRLALSEAEIRSLICLTVYDAYRKALVDGNHPDAGLQPWRRAIWEGTIRNV